MHIKLISTSQKVVIRIGDKKTQPNNYFLGRYDNMRSWKSGGINGTINKFMAETNASNRTDGENNKDHERKRLTEANQVATDQSDQNGTDGEEENHEPDSKIPKNPKVKKVDIGTCTTISVYNHSLPPPTTMFIIYNH